MACRYCRNRAARRAASWYFQGEGNNIARIALPITLATPPDLQVASVSAPDAVLAGQSFTVSYRVVNAGGATPSDQTNWNDLIYLSKDRFLDVNQDRYLGYVQHNGGLAADGSYGGTLSVTAPRGLEGAYSRLRRHRPGPRLGRRRLRPGARVRP